MLPTAADIAADRLITILVTLARAASRAVMDPIPTVAPEIAETLFYRLQGLILHLIRISNLPRRRPAAKDPRPQATDTPPAPPTSDRAPGGLARLPSRRGWLLVALPDVAPGAAAELQTLLADPATATLLEADPTLHRRLKSLLKALHLTPPPPLPSPLPPTHPRPPDVSREADGDRGEGAATRTGGVSKPA